MAKYYLQSGIAQSVVTAADAEGAALWFLNRVLNNALPDNFNLQQQVMDPAQFGLLLSALDNLDAEILVSEIGFGRDEAGRFDTEIMFKHWSTLIHAMQALFEELSD